MAQPDLYSGQTVHYIKKEMGICKCTFPPFLQNLLKPSTTSERQIRLAVGKVKKAVHRHGHLLNHSKAVFTAPVTLLLYLLN